MTDVAGVTMKVTCDECGDTLYEYGGVITDSDAIINHNAEVHPNDEWGATAESWPPGVWGAIGRAPLPRGDGFILDEVRVPDEWHETRNPLHAHMRDTFAACLDISIAKNADYASNDDPLANFRACEQFGVKLTKGIMVRLSDKFARIGNLLIRGAKVRDEAIKDTIHDAINYLAILLYALETKS